METKYRDNEGTKEEGNMGGSLNILRQRGKQRSRQQKGDRLDGYLGHLVWPYS